MSGEPAPARVLVRLLAGVAALGAGIAAVVIVVLLLRSALG
jgi:hypothetical protein